MASVTKEAKIALEGEVVEALPNATFRVVVDGGHSVLGYLGGRLRRSRIRVLPGDRVTIELSPYDLTRGRIVYRHKARPRQPAELESREAMPAGRR
jgi:translation initiation factor IF-1